jgi:DNA-binding GntR family transcriptional regulator
MARRVDIAQQLREDIVGGCFGASSRVTIDELAARYGSSHMPIREALHELHGEGLVLIEPNRGARVQEVDTAFLENLFGLRVAIEVALIRQAALRIDERTLERLDAIEAQLETLIDLRDYAGVLAANREFHSTINRAARNQAANALADRHWLLMAVLWRRYGYSPGRFGGVVNDHRHLIRALRAGDAEAAGVIMAAHTHKARRELVDRIAAFEAGDAVGQEELTNAAVTVRQEPSPAQHKEGEAGWAGQ